MLKACQVAWVALILGLVALAYVLTRSRTPEWGSERKGEGAVKQVYLEVKFIEISEEDTENPGVSWDDGLFDNLELE